MKQIIPLKKDIIFKSKIGDITNINLEKDYKIKDDLLEGFINVFGTYKMTEASVLEEEFNYKVPFGVSLSNGLKKDTIKIEIDDFNYSFNKDVLSIDVLLLFECDDYNGEVEKQEDIEEIEEEPIINQTPPQIEEENNVIDENITNITNNFNNEENYYTYKVYIVREGDTIENICNKYNVSESDLKEYNDISNIKVSDKIVIPYINE